VIDGLLERRGRFFYVKRPGQIRIKVAPTILCLGAGAPDGHFRLDTDRESDFWRELGMQAALAGISLVRQVWSGGKIQIPANAVGVIATTWHYQDRLAICKALATVRVPVCVWLDEAVLDATTRKYRIHYHDQGYSDENGAAIARYLIGLGHRHLAFITPWHDNAWSIKRFWGIQDECSLHHCKIDLHALYGDSEWDRLIPAMNDPKILKKFPHKSIAHMVEGDSSRVLDFMALELGWNRIQKDMEPLFESASRTKATAWIGANDSCALNALKWLANHHIPVPQKVSVAGFDDTVEALRSDLTSFRFSCASVARSMIYQILTRSRGSTLTRHKGSVVVRASIGSSR
jgi:DNA-binding LacI/PurR family transcriptional regulator